MERVFFVDSPNSARIKRRTDLRLPILLVTALLSGSPSHAAQSLGATNKPGEVHGTVLEAASNAPIHKALVILRKGEDAGIGTYTDAAGRFTLHEINAGTYLISAEHNGFVAADPKTQWQSVTVNTGDAGEPITLKLNRTAAISGRIVDADGEPLVGANVRLQPVNPKKSQIVVYASSDDRGNYRAYHIRPGKYKVSVTYSRRRDAPVKIQQEKDKIKDASPDAYGTTYYPGTLDAAQAATIQVDAGADLQGIDIGLRRIKTVRVRGTVKDADGEPPPPLVMVVLSPLVGADLFNAQVRADGRFELDEVTPGKYSVRALGFLQQGKPLTVDQPLEVGEADIDGVQLILGRAQTVTGLVIMPPDRKHLSELVVVLHRKEQSGPQVDDQSGGFTQLNEKGTFSFENVLPGDYDLVVAGVGKGYDLYVATERAGGQDILTSGLQIGGSSPPPIEVVMKANGAKIECTVLDDKQKPVPEAHVTLLPDPPRRSQTAMRNQCQTNESGGCTMLGIAPGDYHAFAVTKDDAVDFTDPATMEGLEKAGKAVTVAQGDQKSIQLGVVQTDY
jgi:hypothetical protein